MPTTLIANATIWDATGAPAFAGDLLVEGNRILAVGPDASAGRAPADQVIDGSGKTLMPGLTEGHAHISFGDAALTEDLIAPSPERHLFALRRNFLPESTRRSLVGSGLALYWRVIEIA